MLNPNVGNTTPDEPGTAAPHECVPTADDDDQESVLQAAANLLKFKFGQYTSPYATESSQQINVNSAATGAQADAPMPPPGSSDIEMGSGQVGPTSSGLPTHASDEGSSHNVPINDATSAGPALDSDVHPPSLTPQQRLQSHPANDEGTVLPTAGSKHGRNTHSDDLAVAIGRKRAKTDVDHSDTPSSNMDTDSD